MIKKVSNIDLNNILTNAADKIGSLKTRMTVIESSVAKRLNMVKNENEFATSEGLAIRELLTGAGADDIWRKIVFARRELTGSYEAYGDCIHPKRYGTTANCFNFITSSGAIFKNSATVKVGGTIDESFKNILKHDSITGKDIFFKEYDAADLTISIETNGIEKLGEAVFNVIEILPFLPGSFSITEARIWTKQDALTGADASVTFSMDRVGQTRYVLDEEKTLAKAEFDIHINFRNGNGKYPFGIKHLYFLDALFEADSYAAAKITSNSGNIDWIGDDAVLRDQDGRKNISLTGSEAGLYLNLEEGEFKFELPITTAAVPTLISHSTDAFYIKIPLTNAVRSLLLKQVILR